MLLCSASNFILRQFHKNMLRPDSDHLEDEIFSSTDLMKQATPVQNEQQRSIEAQRKTWSVFSDKEFVSEHSLQLEQASKSLGKFCQIQSVCVFSANPRAGQQVAVVIDALSDFSNENCGTLPRRLPRNYTAQQALSHCSDAERFPCAGGDGASPLPWWTGCPQHVPHNDDGGLLLSGQRGQLHSCRWSGSLPRHGAGRANSDSPGGGRRLARGGTRIGVDLVDLPLPNQPKRCVQYRPA